MRMKGRPRRTVPGRSLRPSRTWDGEDEALRLRLFNLICGEDGDEAGEFEGLEPGAARPATQVRTLRGLIAWPDPAEDDGEGVPVAPGSTTVH